MLNSAILLENHFSTSLSHIFEDEEASVLACF